MKTRIDDLEFELMISYEEIQSRIEVLAAQITSDYQNHTPVMIGVLNGSFLFFADLVKQIECPCEITFTKLASYFGGTTTTRTIRDDFDLTIDIKNRHVILVEDIVDTGNTMHYLINKLQLREPASITICTMLQKPDALEIPLDEVKYVGFEIENKFVVGYGLDYKELGRNLKGIFRKI